ILAQAEHDGPAGRLQRVAHFFVNRLHVGGLVDFVGAAPVVLQIVDTPGAPGLRVLLFVLVAALVIGTGFGAGGRVDADLEALAVDIIGQRFHVGKLAVGLNVPLGVAPSLPRVVDVDVDVTGVFHAARDHGVGDFADGFVIDLFGELIPTVPTHGRGGS